MSERIDPPGEASVTQISRVLRESQGVEINCGDDVELQTCKFFANVLTTVFRDRHLSVYLFYQPETLVQSFYVPGRLVPTLNDVTLRLIESQGKEGVGLYVGGFCFDPDRKDYYSGLQLPRWVQLERTNDYGPLETDKAEAARKLAMTFAAYWINAVQQQ